MIDRMRGAFMAAAALAVLAACGGSAGSGGDTTCGDFAAMSKDDQTSVIKDFLAEKGDDASNGKIMLTRLSAVAFCKTMGSDSSHIREIDG